MVLRGRRLFVRGVLPMNIKLDVWLSIIHLMVRGGEYFPARVFETSGFPRQFASGESPAVPERPIARFTPREKQILDLVSRGYQNKAIATELELSESTVKVHIHNIISKLGSQNRNEAATHVPGTFRRSRQARQRVRHAGRRDRTPIVLSGSSGR